MNLYHPPLTVYEAQVQEYQEKPEVTSLGSPKFLGEHMCRQFTISKSFFTV